MDLFNAGKIILFETVHYTPHEGQVRMHNFVDHYRYTTVVCGRRFGKTISAYHEAAFQALQPNDASGPPIVYLVSSSYDHATKLFNPLATMFERKLKPFKAKTYRKDRIIELKTGALIKTKSADNPSSLAGDGVTFAILDESGFITDYAVEILLPALVDRKGKMLAIGTPDRSDTWFKRFFDIGLSEDATNYVSLQLPTETNPRINPEELADRRREQGEENYRKYFLAEFLDLAENPFSTLLANTEIIKYESPPQEGHTYVAGIDLADRTDFTAVVVVDVTEKPYKVVKVERWHGIGYEATGARIAGILKAYNSAQGYVDRTGVGDAAIPFITKHYGNIFPIVFTQPEKQSMFDTISTHLEKKELQLLDKNNLLQELRVLRASQTKRGVSYQAPNGQHDDTVMALFLAGKGFERQIYIPRRANLSGFRLPI